LANYCDNDLDEFNTVVRCSGDFINDESGATAIEYGLISALIAVGIIVAARALGTRISGTFNNVGNAMK
jgi:pilus assembly protein Flp/PilA